jgi:subtilisin family serine protease
MAEKGNAVGQKEAPSRIIVSNGLISLQAKDADLKDIINELSRKTGIPLTFETRIEKRVTLSFCRLSIEDALKKLAPNYAIVFTKENNSKEHKIIRAVITDPCETCAGSESIDGKIDSGKAGKIKDDTIGSSERKQRNTSAKADFQSEPEKTGTPAGRFVPNELIVKFKSDISPEEIQNLLKSSGAKVKSHIKQINYYVLTLPPDISVPDAAEYYGQQGAAETVEPNYINTPQAVPNDPDLLSLQWALHNTGQTGGTVDADIDAVEAWDIEQGDPGVIIAIIDTGVDYTHEDLADNIWHNPGEIPDNGSDDDGNGHIDDDIGWDFVTEDNDPMDQDEHGTHVAGIAGAVTNNGIGMAGVCWNCKIMPVRAGDRYFLNDDSAQAIIYAAENGAKVLNLSWGGGPQSLLIADAIAFAADKGALICAAAGNDGKPDLFYPAATENSAVMAIGATDHSDERASFSNYGSWVDVSAPGVSIYSTYLGDGYVSFSGTSMASPVAAGVAALLFSRFDGISPVEVKTAMMSTVDVIAGLDGVNSTSGRINAYTALTEGFNTPHIDSINPVDVHEGDELTLFGENFGSPQGDGNVKFHPDKTAEIISWSDSAIVCSVPDGAQSGEVVVETTDGTSNSIEITVLKKYYEETLLDNAFIGDGQPQGWKADDQSWLYQLPFSFPFFENRYDSVYVCSNGYLDFTDSDASYLNSIDVFKNRAMIAPLWDDLITNGVTQQDEDIYIHSPSPDSVCIRWIAERKETGDAVNVEVVLFENGRIEFNYGSGNNNLSSTVGISGEESGQYHLASYDGLNQLSQVQTVLFLQSFAIHLDLGWNLVSFPLEFENNQVAQVFDSINSGIDGVWGYMDEAWQVYIPGSPGTSTLETLESGVGYWIKTNQEGLKIQNTGQTNTTPVELTIGWNLLGLRSSQTLPIEEALADIEGAYEFAWRYNDKKWQAYDPQNPQLSDLRNLEPGYGYWINAVEDCTWTLP